MPHRVHFRRWCRVLAEIIIVGVMLCFVGFFVREIINTVRSKRDAPHSATARPPAGPGVAADAARARPEVTNLSSARTSWAEEPARFTANNPMHDEDATRVLASAKARHHESAEDIALKERARKFYHSGSLTGDAADPSPRNAASGGENVE